MPLAEVPCNVLREKARVVDNVQIVEIGVVALRVQGLFLPPGIEQEPTRFQFAVERRRACRVLAAIL